MANITKVGIVKTGLLCLGISMIVMVAGYTYLNLWSDVITTSVVKDLEEKLRATNIAKKAEDINLVNHPRVQQEEFTPVNHEGVLYSFPENLRPILAQWADVKLPEDDKGLDGLYYRFVGRRGVECLHKTRLGHFDSDGGWDVCLAEPYNLEPGCIVYSFGINRDWTFDDGVSKNFGCKVFSFDPTIRKKEHNRSALVHFYPLGLSGENHLVNNMTFSTLSTIIQQLGHSESTIDYLKIDIENHEWKSLSTAFKEDALRRVKQIGLEVHSFNGDFRNYINILTQLEHLGFRKWLHHVNMNCAAKKITRCNEIYYINTNFLVSET